jgi:hypothetical protein
MRNLTDALKRALASGGVVVADVSIGSETIRSTWKVQPANLQASAQPIIDAFNPADPAVDAAELDADVTNALDGQRLISSVVWTIIDTYSPPATVAKYTAARTKIVNVFKSQPWKP